MLVGAYMYEYLVGKRTYLMYRSMSTASGRQAFDRYHVSTLVVLVAEVGGIHWRYVDSRLPARQFLAAWPASSRDSHESPGRLREFCRGSGSHRPTGWG